MRSQRLALLAMLLFGTWCSFVHARPDFAANFALDLGGYRLDAPARPATFALAGLGARGAIGGAWIGYRAGLDARLGAAIEGGFAYDVALYPLGFRVPLAEVVGLGVGAGIGANGVTSRIESTGRVPVEAMLDIAPARWLRTGAWFRPAWAFAERRQDGSDHVTFADEFDAGVWLRLGNGNADRNMVWGNGFFVAATYGERLGSTLLGAAVGHSLDMRSP